MGDIVISFHSGWKMEKKYQFQLDPMDDISISFNSSWKMKKTSTFSRKRDKMSPIRVALLYKYAAKWVLSLVSK